MIIWKRRISILLEGHIRMTFESCDICNKNLWSYLNTFIHSPAEITYALLKFTGMQSLMVQHKALVVESLPAKLASIPTIHKALKSHLQHFLSTTFVKYYRLGMGMTISTEWEWEWQLSSDSTASMLAAAPCVFKRFSEGGDKIRI